MKKGFTLIEVLAAMAVLSLLVLLLARMFFVASSTAKNGSSTLSRNSAAQLGMETILQTVEGMVVNDRLSAYFFGPGDAADTTGFGHDEAAFITTATVGNKNKLPYKSYERVRFYVKPVTKTNATGAKYVTYNLIHQFAGFPQKGAPYDPLSPAHTDDWFENYKHWEQETLIPNVVRFDFYLFDYYGDNAMKWDKNNDGKYGMMFKSTKRSDNNISNVPPAAVDIYIQVASEDNAQEAGMLIASGNPTLVQRGKEMLVRDSAIYFGRAVPVAGPARFLEAVAHKPSHYYRPQ